MFGGGGSEGLLLDARQTEEFLLTSAQAVLGFAVLANLRFGIREALALLALFVLQFPFPQTSVRIGFSIAYMALAAVILILQRRSLGPIVSYSFTGRREHAQMEQPDPQDEEEASDAMPGM